VPTQHKVLKPSVICEKPLKVKDILVQLMGSLHLRDLCQQYEVGAHIMFLNLYIALPTDVI